MDKNFINFLQDINSEESIESEHSETSEKETDNDINADFLRGNEKKDNELIKKKKKILQT